MKVGLVVYRDHPASGGSLSVARTLCRHLPRVGIQPTLVVAYGAASPLTRDMGIDVLQTHLDLSGIRRVRSAIRDKGFEIIHYIDPAIRIQALGHDRRAKRVIHVHGRTLLSYMGFSDRILNALLWRTADGVIFISEEGRADARHLRWVTRNSSWVVRNSVEANWFSIPQPRSPILSELHLPDSAKLLGMACRLIPHKGVDDAIRVLDRLPGEWHLAIAGMGPFEDQLRNLAEDQGLAERVHFLGPISDMRSFYSILNGYLFMSRYEPFGLVTAEAMAAGVPVYGLVGEGEFNEGPQPLLSTETAFLVPRARPREFDFPESPERLDALATVIATTKESESERVRDRAREVVQSFFDPVGQARSVAEIYRRLVHVSSNRVR